MALTVDGAAKVTAAAISAGPTLAAALPTGGLSLVAVAAEGEMMLVGAAESAYGASVLAYARKHPVQGPRHTKSNFRKNLEHRTPVPKGLGNPEAHHMLPQALEDLFNRLELGINIHDPRWGAWVEGGLHQQWNPRFTADWRQWLLANPGTTLADVITKATELAASYGIPWP